MLSDAYEKPTPFGKVVVWRGSRIARNVEDRLACQSLLARKGINIVSLNEPEFEGSSKVLLVPVMAAFDEYQSWVISDDTKRSMRLLASQGYSTGGFPPKGYKSERQVIGLKKSGQPRFHSLCSPAPSVSESG